MSLSVMPSSNEQRILFSEEDLDLPKEVGALTEPPIKSSGRRCSQGRTGSVAAAPDAEPNMRPDAANHDFRAVAIPGPRQFAGPCRRATVLGAMLDLCVSSPCLRRLLVPR